MSSDFYIARLVLVEQQGLCKVFTAPRSNTELGYPWTGNIVGASALRGDFLLGEGLEEGDKYRFEKSGAYPSF